MFVTLMESEVFIMLILNDPVFRLVLISILFGGLLGAIISLLHYYLHKKLYSIIIVSILVLLGLLFLAISTISSINNIDLVLIVTAMMFLGTSIVAISLYLVYRVLVNKKKDT